MISAESAVQAVLLPVPARYPGRYPVLIAGLCLAVMISPPAGAEEKLETITVTASPLTTNPDQYASIVGQVSRDDILRSGGANLADALKDVPGVTGSGGGSMGTVTVIITSRVVLVRVCTNEGPIGFQHLPRPQQLIVAGKGSIIGVVRCVAKLSGYGAN